MNKRSDACLQLGWCRGRSPPPLGRLRTTSSREPVLFNDCTRNNLEFRGTACLKNTQTTCQKRIMIRDDLQNVESESDGVQRE